MNGSNGSSSTKDTEQYDIFSFFEKLDFFGTFFATEATLLIEFKKMFDAHFSANIRENYTSDVSRINRRLDSLARLLEQSSVCTAVTYDPDSQQILIATNKIHKNSRLSNIQIENIKKVMDLLAADLTLDKVADELTQIVFNNLLPENRWFKGAKNQLFDLIKGLIANFFASQQATKDWEETLLSEYDSEESESDSEEDGLDNKLIKIAIKKVSRLVRDFLKLKNSLLERSNCNYPNDHTSIISLIANKEYTILKEGSLKEHAEMRIASRKQKNYVGISKLCCAHCGLGVEILGVPVRGKHGKAFSWAIPEFVLNDEDLLEKFMGSQAFRLYTILSEENKQKAINYIVEEVRKTQGNKKGVMLAEASDSDEELEIEDNSDGPEDLFLHELIVLMNLKKGSPKEFDGLKRFLSTREIINIYLASNELFEAFGSPKGLYLLENKDEDTIDGAIEELTNLFSNNNTLFSIIINDEHDLVKEFEDIADLVSKYDEIEKNLLPEERNITDIMSIIYSEITKEGGYDFSENNSNSEPDEEEDNFDEDDYRRECSPNCVTEKSQFNF